MDYLWVVAVAAVGTGSMKKDNDDDNDGRNVDNTAMPLGIH